MDRAGEQEWTGYALIQIMRTRKGKNATEGTAQMELQMNIFFSYIDIET